MKVHGCLPEKGIVRQEKSPTAAARQLLPLLHQSRRGEAILPLPPHAGEGENNVGAKTFSPQHGLSFVSKAGFQLPPE
jgi:hypothetical protein